MRAGALLALVACAGCAVAHAQPAPPAPSPPPVPPVPAAPLDPAATDAAASRLLEDGRAAERAGALERARAAYRAVVADYPSARASRLAEARLAALDAAGGADGRWDAVAAEHDRLLAAAAAGDPTARPALAALLATAPGYPRWGAAGLWLADEAVRGGDTLGAAIWYRRTAAFTSAPGERFRAGLGEAGLWIELGELARARAAYRALDPPDPVAARARARSLGALEQLRRRRAWSWVARGALLAAAVVAALVLRRRRGGWGAAARGLWPPPVEVAYLAPVAVVITFVAETGNPLAARAAELMLAGALAIGWLSGAVARAAPRPPWRGRVLHLAIVLAATAAVVYLAVVSEGLWELLVQTWQRGHDGR